MAKKTEVRFMLYNTGHRILTVNDIVSDCQCTKPECEIRDILPGDSSTVKVNILPTLAGPIMQKITVYSNACNSPEILIIRAVVI
ncbi:hypothetical protein DDR33_11500 [Pararcticibacter amylolyticus]|uniref:DUF1573 domain-containing protein n=2 Tax=Pararcticibacter amylolyticus TaxID=2173175 RepID=A0A2U2PGW0_9SPHI|nr:hypothetical protein DDR33_11500 [Pararcticibacter amylolyticus]